MEELNINELATINRLSTHSSELREYVLSYVEEHHIALGNENWKKNISHINKEYDERYEIISDAEADIENARLLRRKRDGEKCLGFGFCRIFNHRDLEIDTYVVCADLILRGGYIYNQHRNIANVKKGRPAFVSLPKNY